MILTLPGLLTSLCELYFKPICLAWDSLDIVCNLTRYSHSHRDIIPGLDTIYYDYFQRIFEEAGDLIDIFRLADDIGAQDNLLSGLRDWLAAFCP